MVEQAEPGETEEKDDKPEPLTEKQLNEVPIAIEVFSMEVVCQYIQMFNVHIRVQNLDRIVVLLVIVETFLKVDG